MNLTGNTILITGGGSGIGRGLAEAFHAQGNQVIIAGRRQSVLDEVTAANPGMAALTLDIESPGAITAFAAQIGKDFPALNVVINNAGIMKFEDLQHPDLSISESVIATNLLGPLRLTAALLPQLKAQPKATIMTVSSGLGFVALAHTPTYSATKAAIHSWSQSLRWQLKNTSVEVLEIAPPYVQTELLTPQGATDPNAMPLADFITETMAAIAKPTPDGEVLVERVHRLRYAERNGKYDETYNFLNSTYDAAMQKQQ